MIAEALEECDCERLSYRANCTRIRHLVDLVSDGFHAKDAGTYQAHAPSETSTPDR
jgi:hypothetical protein